MWGHFPDGCLPLATGRCGPVSYDATPRADRVAVPSRRITNHLGFLLLSLQLARRPRALSPSGRPRAGRWRTWCAARHCSVRSSAVTPSLLSSRRDSPPLGSAANNFPSSLARLGSVAAAAAVAVVPHGTVPHHAARSARELGLVGARRSRVESPDPHHGLSIDCKVYADRALLVCGWMPLGKHRCWRGSPIQVYATFSSFLPFSPTNEVLWNRFERWSKDRRLSSPRCITRSSPASWTRMPKKKSAPHCKDWILFVFCALWQRRVLCFLLRGQGGIVWRRVPRTALACVFVKVQSDCKQSRGVYQDYITSVQSLESMCLSPTVFVSACQSLVSLKCLQWSSVFRGRPAPRAWAARPGPKW